MKVFVNGCFDVLHRGHFQLIHYAASLGELTVALDSDEKVARDKGPDRPIYPLEDRVYQMTRLRGVGTVLAFSTREELERLVEYIKPDIMIVGSDWKGKEVVGSQYAKEVRFFDRLGDYSTTKTIQGSPYR
jgi:D-beta-D-heptose 7-phosphate kinase/D-beta-D-heptose 1-phosphate adenosyltransferase|tara:strand:+ start:2364 stop:2756 length:393 start_codon:yes stop_codon:yes gene_type:complete